MKKIKPVKPTKAVGYQTLQEWQQTLAWVEKTYGPAIKKAQAKYEKETK